MTSTAESAPGVGYCLSVAIVWLASVIVPGWCRATWRREWLGELWHARGLASRPNPPASVTVGPRPDLVRRSLGSIRHALWLRGRHWRYDVLAQDFRYAIRTLLKSPGFTAVAVITLALGIGANSAVFNLASAMLLQPYPYAEPERLVRVFGLDLETGRNFNMSFPDYADLVTRSRSLASLALTDREPYNVGGGEQTSYVQGAQVSASLFDLLGTTPLLGRTFASDEEGPDSPRVVVLGEALWRNSFAAEVGIVGSEITIDAEPHVVIGVVPEGGGYPDEARLWVPVRFDPAAQRRSTRWANVIARLADGVDEEAARQEVGALAAALTDEYPESNVDVGFQIVGLREIRTSDFRQVIPLLLGVVGAVLLIACANVAGLILSRGAARGREFAVRTAIGAGRARIVRQLLTESAVLAAAGTLLGFGLGVSTVGSLVAAAPVEIPEWVDFAPDWRVAVFTALASVVAVFLSGLAPALRITRDDPIAALKDTHGDVGPARQRTRTLLITAEIAVSIILLVGAGLMIRSFLSMSSVDTGYDTEGTFMLTTAFADATYSEPPQRLAFYRDARERLLAIPGVEAVGGIAQPPLRGGWSIMPFQVDGREPAEEGREPGAYLHVVTPGYLDAAGIALLRGRDLNDQDSAPEATDVALVNRALAAEFWPGEEPLGKRFRFDYMDEDVWINVVGVVDNTKQRDVIDQAGPEIYYPYERWASFYGRMTWMVKTSTDPLPLIAAAQAEVRALDPDQALYDVMTMRAAVDESLWSERFATTLFGAFGAIALLLAAVGLYGLIAYATSRRTHEIGIRMALGADAGSVLGTVLRTALKPAAIGGAVGLAGAFAVSRLLSGLLYEVSPSDPMVYVAVAALMALVAIGAGIVPALRAARVNPIDALRAE